MNNYKEEVVDRLLGTKEFIIDFGSWNIEARDSGHAYDKAKAMLERDIPEIVNIEEV